MGSIKKLVKASIKDANIEGDPLKDGVATTAKFVGDSVESGEINDGTVTGDDLASPLNLSSKTVTLPNTSVTAGMLSDTLDLSSKTVTLPDGTISFDREYFNISLLGFKMAVTESLTVFNLVDGVVDEFHDESGTDEAEGSNDTYCATSDLYSNSTPAAVSAGFTTSSITEPDTSTTGTNPTQGCGQMGTFTVPFGMTTADIKVWGAGGTDYGGAGGGGYAEGTLATTSGQALKILAGEGGQKESTGAASSFLGGGMTGASSPGLQGAYGSGGGLAGVFSVDLVPLSSPQYSAPTAYVVAGSGGAGGYSNGGCGGAGGGLTGDAGNTQTEQTNNAQGGGSPATEATGGGGDQEQGGQGGTTPSGSGQNGSLFKGGNGFIPAAAPGGGGAGYYGGGGGSGHGNAPGPHGSGGGGSSYYGHPQISSGSTEEGAAEEGGGTAIPGYVAGTNEAGAQGSGEGEAGEDGYVLITGTKLVASSTTIVSNAFAAGSVPTTSRIVVFEENVDTPTLNTDIIASISRDGGTTFTTATLTDSGYVTGASGQRILTGQATISGQPSGQSMRWKLALANNQVKIHGVSLSWA